MDQKDYSLREIEKIKLKRPKDCYFRKSEIEQYISTIKGISGANIELLADVLKVMGTKSESEVTNAYLGKA